MITKAECHICRKGPFLRKNLYAHLRLHHGCSEDVIEDVKKVVKRRENTGREELPCDICGLNFFTSSGLYKHRKTKHGSEEVSSSSETERLGNSVTCPGCPEAFRYHVELASHCREHHSNGDASQDVMESTFQSWDDFEIWKTEKEFATYTRLVRRTVRRSAHDTFYYFICQHARGSEEVLDPQEQKERYKGSKKIHKHCPSFAKVRHSHDGTLHVTAYFGHLGHEIKVSSFRISVEDEEVIKTMITTGVPYRTIVTKLRAEHWIAGKNAQLQSRLCFVTMRDISNIAIRNGLIDGRTSDDDRISLKTLLEDDRMIAASRFIDTADPTGDGFVLAFVTKHGKEYLEQYGHHGLVLDDTFNVTRYSLRLATLAVVDDAGNGFSCAHLLSFRMTTMEVRHLFEVIKECVPDFAPRYVMTDDTYVFYNAFKEVFSSSPAEKILCSFHIGQTLQRKHKEVLTGADVEIGNRLFQAVLFEVEIPKFESKFAAYMTWLSSIGATEMLTYIERNYSGRRREWAACYRRDARFTTSNHLESWHCMLKHALLRSKQNGRLDTLTHTLLKHGEDRNLQLIASSVRDASDVSGRRRRNILRHKNALSSYAQKPDAIVKEDDNRWKVFCGTRTDVSYEVLIGSPCDCDSKLNSHCQRCGICAYQVSCNCHEAYQAGVSCIHAHAVATFVEEARLLLGSANSQPMPLYSVMEDVGTSAEMYVEGSIQSDGSPTRTAPDVSAPPEDVLTQDRTKEAYHFSEGKLAQVGEMLRVLMKEGQYDLLQKCGEALGNVLELVPPHLRTTGTLVRRMSMQTTGVGPKPKNIQPAFRTRASLNRERSSRRKLGQHNIIEETQRILTVDRTLLQTCFVCGRRNPEEDGENDVLWVSCTNQDVCKAWAHLQCTSGVESSCAICEEGYWQFEEV